MLASQEAEITNLPVSSSKSIENSDHEEKTCSEYRILRNDAKRKAKKRAHQYSLHLPVNPPRPDKKLLVLDIDYTIFDHKSSAESFSQLMRPNLIYFLESVYQHFDIIIWSATNILWVQEKLKGMGLLESSKFQFLFLLDSRAMIPIVRENEIIYTKNLDFIWFLCEKLLLENPHLVPFKAASQSDPKKNRLYHKGNTILVDDCRRNYLSNPQNGIHIRPYKNSTRPEKSTVPDVELLYLRQYLLEVVVPAGDVCQLKMASWRKQYVASKSVEKAQSKYARGKSL